MFEGLPLALKFAKKSGFRTYISTNAHGFTAIEKKHKILADCDQICISLHGACPETQHEITGCKYSYDEALKALECIELSRYSPNIIINTVLCRQNIGEIPRIAETVSRFTKVSQLLVSNMVPEGAALDGYEQKTLTLSEAEKAAAEIAGRFSERFLIRFFGFPLCTLGRHRALSNDLAYDPRLTVELEKENGETALSEIFVREPVYMRTKPPVCDPCIYNGICGGLFEKYHELFGDGELKPVAGS